jgi:hypothetical protein
MRTWFLLAALALKMYYSFLAFYFAITSFFKIYKEPYTPNICFIAKIRWDRGHFQQNALKTSKLNENNYDIRPKLAMK